MSTFAIHSHVACTSFAESGSKFAAKSAHSISTKRARRTKTCRHKNRIPSGSATALTYDLDGNMTSDGTNSYAWDCENRLIKITYPGTGNYSTFAYDGFSRNVQILEYTSSSLTSTKNFLWCNYGRSETRNANGSVTAQFFGYGEKISGSLYYWTNDNLASVREMTNSAGAIQSQFSYDPYGRSTQIQGATSSDFQYAGYYFHAPSGLCLTAARGLNCQLGRWLARDPLGEIAGTNVYTYCDNDPADTIDPVGLMGELPQPKAVQPAGGDDGLMAGGGQEDPPEQRDPKPPMVMPNDPCVDILARIERAVDELKKRFRQAKNNRRKIPVNKCDRQTKGAGTQQGHKEAFDGWKRNLKKAIDDWTANNCGTLPDEAQEWLQKDYPNPVPDSD